MKHIWAQSLFALVLCFATPSNASPQNAVVHPELSFSVVEGQNINVFFREGPVAAHLLLRNGTEPRVLVAFPAGNSGVGLWFEKLPRAARWRVEQMPHPIALSDARGRTLQGIESTASIDARRLVIRQAVLSNVRFLRDYQSVGRFPPEVSVGHRTQGNTIVWARDRVDGAPGYRLEVEVVGGSIQGDAIVANGKLPVRLRIRAATGDAPMTGLSKADLFNDRAAPDPAARRTLAFLSYREKFLAGSWRFNTYFGRDTLMSVQLLMPVLRGPAVEAGLNSVLVRLNTNGEVAHEEGLSEFAILERRATGQADGDGPTLDYGMIDDDYMLAPVAANYLLDQATLEAARDFLARPVRGLTDKGTSEPAGALLVRNLRFVTAQAAPFVVRPEWRRLIAIKAGRLTGEWRDSEEGLGRGRYPYDVNAVLVPTALGAADKLLKSGLLDPYLTAEGRAELASAGSAAAVWNARAPDMFSVSVPSGEAKSRIRAYATEMKVRFGPAIRSIGARPLVFHAISIDADGRPVPIINSDDGFALLFGNPSAAELQTYVGALARPFPAGLMTDVGMLVANPMLADKEVRLRFSPSAYHGAVIWSWQQALFAAGLERQLARRDLPAPTRATLQNAQATLWRAIAAARATQSSELWSWTYENGHYRVVPFGAGRQDVDESNAAQLWSTVYLAIRPPRRARQLNR